MAANLEIVNKAIDTVFSNTSENDAVMYPATSNQSIHIGASTGATTPSLLKITSSNVEINSQLYVTSSNGIKFSDSSIQSSAYSALGQQIGSYGNTTSIYLPTTSAGAVVIVSGTAYTLSMLGPNSVTIFLNGSGIGGVQAAGIIRNTWNTSVAGQVSFYAGYFDGTNTKVVGVTLKDTASGITAYQSAALYYSGNTIASSQWTTSGGIPTGSTANPPGSTTYGVSFLMISL